MSLIFDLQRICSKGTQEVHFSAFRLFDFSGKAATFRLFGKNSNFSTFRFFDFSTFRARPLRVNSNFSTFRVGPGHSQNRKVQSNTPNPPRQWWTWQPGQGDDAFEVGLNECSIFLFTFGTWKSQTSVDPSTLDTTGNAKVMVLHRQNLNEGEPGRLEHQGIIEREA